MVRVMAVPQREVREGPVGREGGEVMRPWERTVGMRVKRVAAAAAVKCILAAMEAYIEMNYEERWGDTLL